MQSPLKRIIVYDFETGGLNVKYNPVTEMAGVVLDLETLEIIEEFSVMLKPRMDLSIFEEETTKEAKAIFGDLSTKDVESGIKTLMYKGTQVTPKTINTLCEDIEKMRNYLKSKKSNIIDWENYLELQNTELKDISTLYLNRCYNPYALEVTHISLDLMLKEGVVYAEAFDKIKSLFIRHTVGNNKPIIAGHNILDFDNPFMAKIFADHKEDFLKYISDFMLDTLDLVKLRWFELPSFSLGVCANAAGLTLKEAHRALPDTIANAKLLIVLLKNLRGEGSQESTYVRKKYSFNF